MSVSFLWNAALDVGVYCPDSAWHISMFREKEGEGREEGCAVTVLCSELLCAVLCCAVL